MSEWIKPKFFFRRVLPVPSIYNRAMNFNTNDFYDVNFLETQSDPFYSFLVFDELSSTNTYLKERAGKLAEGSVCIADAQSGGKGRNGRSFLFARRLRSLSFLTFKAAKAGGKHSCFDNCPCLCNC